MKPASFSPNQNKRKSRHFLVALKSIIFLPPKPWPRGWSFDAPRIWSTRPLPLVHAVSLGIQDCHLGNRATSARRNQKAKGWNKIKCISIYTGILISRNIPININISLSVFNVFQCLDACLSGDSSVVLTENWWKELRRIYWEVMVANSKD